MPGSNNGDTTWFSATTTPTRFTTSDYYVPSGVAIQVSAAASFGNRSTITHATGATTDGFPMAADTVYTIPPSLIDGNLKNLYVVAASGSVSVWVVLPKYDTTL